MNKNTKQMNIYSDDTKEEKKNNLNEQTIDSQSFNLHLQILEKFLHNMAGKMNICNFLFDMDANKEEIKNVFMIMESMLLLYRGILLNRSDLNIPNYVFSRFIEDKGGECIINNLLSFIEEKVFLLILLYNGISNNTKVILEKNSLIVKDKDIQNIIQLINQYNIKNSKYKFIQKYITNNNEIIFSFL
jgi:hypothetical protein